MNRQWIQHLHNRGLVCSEDVKEWVLLIQLGYQFWTMSWWEIWFGWILTLCKNLKAGDLGTDMYWYVYPPLIKCDACIITGSWICSDRMLGIVLLRIENMGSWKDYAGTYFHIQLSWDIQFIFCDEDEIYLVCVHWRTWVTAVSGLFSVLIQHADPRGSVHRPLIYGDSHPLDDRFMFILGTDIRVRISERTKIGCLKSSSTSSSESTSAFHLTAANRRMLFLSLQTMHFLGRTQIQKHTPTLIHQAASAQQQIPYWQTSIIYSQIDLLNSKWVKTIYSAEL